MVMAEDIKHWSSQSIANARSNNVVTPNDANCCCNKKPLPPTIQQQPPPPPPPAQHHHHHHHHHSSSQSSHIGGANNDAAAHRELHTPSPSSLSTSANTTSTTTNSQPRHDIMKDSDPAWFQGKITREDAEALLTPKDDGLFLIRESTNFPGDYALCVCFNQRVEHYRVIYNDHKLTIDEEEFFDTLVQLVEHYRLDADGLCTKLGEPVGARQKSTTSATTTSTVTSSKPLLLDPSAFEAAGWVIKMSDLKLGELLGKGEFGDILLGTLHGAKVAVKKLKDSNSKAAQEFLTEATLMTSLQHHNLVQLLGVVFDGPSVCFVTEYMAKGSLVDYLRSRGRLHVTQKDQICFAADTCAGMAYLESKHVIHRDLAARNVLISEEGVAKVCDFGLAKDQTLGLDGGKFPIKWTAPEALRYSKFSNKSDMWSFGILLWEIYSFGRVPYPRIPLADVVKKVEKGYRMEAPEGCPTEIYDTMKQAWNIDADKRPTFVSVSQKLDALRAATAGVHNANT